MELVLLQAGLTLLVLLVGVYHLYLDQFTEPESDIQIRADQRTLAYGTAGEDGAKLHFEFIANNRGDDNGYIQNARLIRFEYSETEDFSDPDVVECEELTTPTGKELGMSVPFYLDGDDEPHNGLIRKDEITTIEGTCDVYAGDLHEIHADYYSMRAVVRFQCRDSSREYKRTAPTNRIEVW